VHRPNQCEFAIAVSCQLAECCERDDLSSKQDADVVNTGRNKRTSGDVQRQANKCFRSDVTASDPTAAAADDDDHSCKKALRFFILRCFYVFSESFICM